MTARRLRRNLAHASLRRSIGGGLPGDDLLPVVTADDNGDANASPTAAVSAAVVSITPADDGDPVSPLSPVRVDVAQGTLTSVTLTNPDGKVIPGITTPDGTSWKPSEPLGYGKTYTLDVAATDANGVPTSKNSTVTTLDPGNQTKAYLRTTGGAEIRDGGTYGVGMRLLRRANP